MTAMPDDDLAMILAGIDNEEEIEVPEPIPVQPPITIEPINTTIGLSLLTESESDDNDDDSDDSDNKINLDQVYNESVTELLTNYRQDRTDITTLISLLYDKINTASNPSRVYFEALAGSLRTRSESNTNLLKLLDSINKRSNNNGGSFNLEDLLSDE